MLSGISGLTPGTSYHWRVVAENHCNEAVPSEVCTTYGAEEFESLPPVSIRDFTTQTVGPELVTFKAELNPNGSESTYTLRYGLGPGYTCETGHVCSTSGTISIGGEFEPIETTFSGLKPNTLYHYQLVAENVYGEVETADRTFTTERSSVEERAAESCPNTNLREENQSLALPDCRAYEQASERNKEGFEAYPGEFAFTAGGNRVYYFSSGAFDGAAQNELAIQYIGERFESGWKTHPMIAKRLTPPGEEPVAGVVMSPEMDRWLLLESPGINAEKARVAQIDRLLLDGICRWKLSPPRQPYDQSGGRAAASGLPVHAKQRPRPRLFKRSQSGLYDHQPASPCERSSASDQIHQ